MGDAVDRRGFLTALLAVPVAGLVGLGVMRRLVLTTVDLDVEAIRLIFKDAMIYGTGVMKAEWKGGTPYRRPDPWKAIDEYRPVPYRIYEVNRAPKG